MNMIEKVARALAVAEGETPDNTWLFYEAYAKAAISAMREPTDSMVDALYSALDDREVHPAAAGEEEAIRECIAVMMDAASL